MLYMNANISPTSEHNTTQLQAPRIWNKCKIETFGEAWGRIPPPTAADHKKTTTACLSGHYRYVF